MGNHVTARIIILAAVLCLLCGDIALGYWLTALAGHGVGGMVSLVGGFIIGMTGAAAWTSWGQK